MEDEDRIVCFPEVVRRTGLSRSGINGLEKRGLFPRRRYLSPYKCGWFESEIVTWLDTRPSERPARAPRKAKSR